MAVDTIDFTSLDTVALLASDTAVDCADDLAAAGKIGAGLQVSLTGLSAALAACSKAKSEAAAYLYAPPGTVLAQQVADAQVRAAVALQAVEVAHQAYRTALDEAPAVVYARLLPKPAGQGRWPWLVADTTKVLEQLAPEDRAPGAARLLAAALARDDAALAFLLAGKQTPLTMAYARLGVSESELALHFGPVLAAHRASDAKGARLYDRLQRTGSANSLRKVQVAVAAALHYLRNG